jgi:hypothetical protein
MSKVVEAFGGDLDHIRQVSMEAVVTWQEGLC